MSKNLIFNYSGISGLFCQCGNAEVIVMENPLYHTYRHFSTMRDNSGGPGQLLAACRKCHAEWQNPNVRPQPADLRERLQAAYPGIDVDDLLAQCTHSQALHTANPAYEATMTPKLDPEEIAALRAAHYYVAAVAGQSDERYAWANSKSGARQEHTQQPARRSKDQAWRDCQDYVDGEGGAPAQPDWLDK